MSLIEEAWEERRQREEKIPEELMNLALQDPTVYACLCGYTYAAEGYVKALERCILILAKEKKNYSDQLIQERNLSVKPLRFNNDEVKS